MKLTDEQMAAANHNSGHARVVAVAGAGKTATLLHFLKNRIDSGADPRRILVLMYNRAAKDAFEKRILQLALTKQPTIRTFHALGLKLYQRLIDYGYLPPRSLKPLTKNVIDLQLKQLLQANESASQFLHGNEAVNEWVETVGSFIQLVKCHLNGAEHTLNELNCSKEHRFIIEIFHQFEAWRKDHHAITYDDMLFDPATIFLKEPKSRALFSDILDEVLVDEYQDINPIQHFLLTIISSTRAKVIVIGDPDQTIYEFRGSSPSFINNTFANDFKNPVSYSLSKTFRFGHELALAANYLITNNHRRDSILTISANNTPQTSIQLAETDNHGLKVVSTIKALHGKGAPYCGMAILCRLWSFARPVELQLLAQGIPYCIEGEQSILQCWEIRPFFHLLNILSGHFITLSPQKKSQSLFEILSIPSPKIPHKILQDIAKQWTTTIEADNLHNSLKKVIPHDLSTYQKRSFKKITDALKSLQSSKSCSEKLKSYALLLEYQQTLKDTALTPTKGIEQAGTVDAFLKFIQTLPKTSAQDMQSHLLNMQNNTLTMSTDNVTITTIHRSKGREWPAVFIPDLTEGHIPYLDNNTELDVDSLESERRLMYVAMTRTQKKLFLTTSIQSDDILIENKNREQAKQSRFISEMNLALCKKMAATIASPTSSITCEKHALAIAKQYVRSLHLPIEILCEAPLKVIQTNKSYRHENKTHKRYSYESNTITKKYSCHWSTGSRVRHAILGLGEIVKIEGEKIRIQFDTGSTRTFVSQIAEPHLSPE